jgi:hypothetical protein
MTWSRLMKAAVIATLACCFLGPYPGVQEELNRVRYYGRILLERMNPLPELFVRR